MRYLGGVEEGVSVGEVLGDMVFHFKDIKIKVISSLQTVAINNLII
jgi:hypothetical protein